MGGVREDLAYRSLLDHAACIHDGDVVGEIGDDREVVRDVQRGDAVLTGERANGGKHVLLSRHVEASRRLVEHDDRRAAGEGHRESDALLLTTRELVRIALEVFVVCRQEYLGHHLLDAGLARHIRATEVVCLEHLHQLGADAQRRIERGRGVLRHVRHALATDLALALVVEREHLDATTRHGAVVDLHATTGVSEHGETDGRLAGTRLSDEAEHAARFDRKRHLVDDVVARGRDVEPQVGDREALTHPCPLGRCPQRRATCRRR